MRILVCIKQVPDLAADIFLDQSSVRFDESALVINPWDEYAIEAALKIKDTISETVVIAISVGDQSAKKVLRHALAMGCDEAILGLATPDDWLSQMTSIALASLIKQIGKSDLVLFGRKAIDTDNGITAAQTARLLDWPLLSNATNIAPIHNEELRVECSIENGKQIVRARLPAIISVGKEIGEPRYTSLMRIRKASSIDIVVWSMNELGISLPSVPSTSKELVKLQEPARKCEIITGNDIDEQSEALIQKLLATGVIK